VVHLRGSRHQPTLRVLVVLWDVNSQPRNQLVVRGPGVQNLSLQPGNDDLRSLQGLLGQLGRMHEPSREELSARLDELSARLDELSARWEKLAVGHLHLHLRVEQRHTCVHVRMEGGLLKGLLSEGWVGKRVEGGMGEGVGRCWHSSVRT